MPHGTLLDSQSPPCLLGKEICRPQCTELAQLQGHLLGAATSPQGLGKGFLGAKLWSCWTGWWLLDHS